MSAYTMYTFPISDAGSKWFHDNFLQTGRIDTVTDMIVAAEDPLSIRIVTATGSGKLVIGDPTTVQQVVAAWKLYSGQVGASNPSDPISASVNNLVKSSTAAAGSTAIATTDKAKDAVNSVAVKTGLPIWLVWVGVIVIAWFVIKWIWKKIRRRRR